MPPRNAVHQRDPSLGPLLLNAAENAFLLACSDPLAVTRALARALRHQTNGAKMMVLRRLVESLDETEPGILDRIATDLAQISKEKA